MMLVASGLVESRAKAQRLIKAGHVRVDGETITKPSFMVKAGHSELAVDKGDDYVSRGAYKPVSYTHLDVYKRQDVASLDGGFQGYLDYLETHHD